MDYPLCDRCGLDASMIQERLRLLELDEADMERQGRALQENVIAPNVGNIVARFYGALARIDEFGRILREPAALSRLKASQEDYLRGLGVDFREREYFEKRLRIGAAHQAACVPQSLYQCAYQKLQSLLIDTIPGYIRDDEEAFESMLQFILKITALDMSLAAESYCSASVSDLKRSLASERDESTRLRELAVTDWLTNLRNHSYSRRCLEAALERAADERSALCVIMADLDRFKNINDKYGHLVGDEVLQIAAARMLSAARGGDEVCRYGGEEFLWILQNTDIPEGLEVAERIRSRINADTIQSGDKRIRISLSLGLARARRDDTVNSLIDRADEALYRAKAAGRNCLKSEARQPREDPQDEIPLG